MAFFFLIHFAEHADYLSMYKYTGENNILLSQAVALVFAGTLFPELKMPHSGKKQDVTSLMSKPQNCF
ncbi:heparinase II/III family protein [Bacteroides sp. CR5/BHMF/2]|nr:heparinase II/III family protein [Bacteroides sp. CR5/BHMF/2]